MLTTALWLCFTITGVDAPVVSDAKPAAPASSPAESPAPKVQRLGVFDVTVAGLDPAFKATAIDSLAAAVSAIPGYATISSTELQAMVSAETIKQTLGCDDVTCMAELGMAAGVERILSGSVGATQGALLVNLQLVNTASAKVESRMSVKWDGPPEGLGDALAVAAHLLLIPEDQRTPGTVRLTGLPATAIVTVDGQARGAGPITLEGLVVGVHHLRVEADGFDTYERPLAVLSGQDRKVQVQLALTPPKPIYARWWFWTIAGVVVAGGATAAVLASHSSSSPKGTLNVGVPIP